MPIVATCIIAVIWHYIIYRTKQLFLPYMVNTGDTVESDPELVTLHLYCPLVLMMYDVMLSSLTIIHFPKTFLSQRYVSDPWPVALHCRVTLELFNNIQLSYCGCLMTGGPV